MKYVKVRITRGGVGEHRMVYPARYDSREVARSMAGGLEYSGGIRRGDDEEWMLVLLDDALAAEYAKDPDMEIVSDTEADALWEQWRAARGEPVERVTDPNRMLAIVAKVQAGIELSAEDQAALDPESDVPGVNRTPKPSELRKAVDGDRAVRGEG